MSEGAEVGHAYIALLPSLKGFGRRVVSEGGSEVDRAGAESGRRFGDVFVRSSLGPLRGFGEAAVGLFAADKIKDFFQESIALARQQQRVTQETQQVIKSTGGAANVTAEQVAALSERISANTGVSHLAVQAGARMLLTFRGIRNEAGKGNDIFNQSVRTVNNLAAAMAGSGGQGGGDSVKGAAIQLGKALNDPLRGITALTRVGVTFSTQQRKQIKTLVDSGHTLGAQKIILRELNTEFGGAAKASTTMGQKVGVAFEDIKEKVGTALLPGIDAVERGLLKTLFPALTRASNAFSTTVVPVLQRFSHFIATEVVPAVQSLIKRVGPPLRASVLAGFRVFETDVLPVLRSVGAFILQRLVPAVGKILAAAFDDFRRAVQQIGGALQKHRAQLTQVLHAVRDVAKFVLAVAVPVFKVALRLAFQNLVRTITAVIGAISNAVTAFDKIVGAAKAVISYVKSHWKSLVPLLGGPILAAVGEVITHFSQIQSGVSHVVGRVIGFMKGLPGRIVSAVGDLGSILYNAGTQAIGGLVRGLLDSAKNTLTGALHHITSLIPLHKGPIEKDRKLLHPTGVAIMHGLVAGITAGESELTDKLKSITRQFEQFAPSIASRSVANRFKNQWSDAMAAVSKRLSTLSSTFKQVQSEQSDLASSIKSTLVSGASFSNAPSPNLTAALAFKRQQLAGVRTFRRDLDLLRKRGLNNAELNDLASQGLDALPVLEQLTHATAGQIHSINAVDKAIRANAKAIGNEQAASTYNPQLDHIRDELRDLKRVVAGDGRRIVDAERRLRRHGDLKTRTKTGTAKSKAHR